MTPPPATVDRFETEGRSLLSNLAGRIDSLHANVRVSRLGHVVESADGVAMARGLERAVAGELLDIDGVPARAEMVSEDLVRMVLFENARSVRSGAPVRKTGRVLDVPAGMELLGRTLDALGRPHDGLGPLHTRRRVAVEGDSAPLADREPVRRPLRTGLFAIDTMIPIGRGQRQLVVGDRSTGKTQLGLDILAALETDVIGIYVGIGRRGTETTANLQWLDRRGFFTKGFAVIAEADDPVGMIQLAPYSAMAMAEDLRDEGHDVVIVFDDLTSHAHAHRTLALLLGRPVGREAYPVDVFYAHARLLERAAQLGQRRGSGSLTALPIIETQRGDLTAYIPTNLVSITDGQIRLDAALVTEGQMPAVDIGLSVSRVGGKAQMPLIRTLCGQFKNRYAQFLELETFTRFGARVEAHAQGIIDWGRRVRLALRQSRAGPLSWAETASTLLILEDPRLIEVTLRDTPTFIQKTRENFRSRHPEIWARLEAGDALEEGDGIALSEVLGKQLAPPTDA